MRNLKFVILAVFCTFLMAVSEVSANISTEWMRTGNRNAATDSTDIVIYNPAGLTKMSEGFYLNIGNQSLFRSPEHTFDLGLPASNGEKTRKQDDPDLFWFNFYGAYNEGKFSIFGGFYIPGGGLAANYPNGSINTQFLGAMTVLGSSGMFTEFKNDYLEATSAYYTTEIGTAYQCNEKISMAVGLRYVNAQNEVKAGATFIDVGGNDYDMKLRYDTDADGVGGIFGMNISATDNLNIGMRYETRVVLNFHTNVKRNDFSDEFELVECYEKNRRDCPGMLGIGAEYRLSPQLTTEVDFNWYLQKEADWGQTSDGKDISNLAGDYWSLGGTFAYQVSEDILVSIGTIYTQFEWGDIDAYYEKLGEFEVLYTDNWYIGTGFAWEIKENVTFNFAVGQAIWDDKTIEYVQVANNGLPPVEVKTENATTTVAFGFDLAF
jgi:long-chain fatty acid transport protein